MPHDRLAAVGRAAAMPCRLRTDMIGAAAVALRLLGGQRDAERTCHTDRRCAAHGEAADGVDHRVDVTHLDQDDLRREARLVDQDDVVAAPLDRAHQPGS